MITRAAQNLGRKQFIQIIPNRKKRGEFGTHEYILCRSDNGEPLQSAKSLLYANKVRYFTFPYCVVKESTANWSLAKMTGSELRLYVSILWLANQEKSNEFQSNAARLRKLSGLAPATFPKALDALEERGLIWVTGNAKSYNVHLCDPYTGEPLYEPDGIDKNDPANYFVTDEEGRAKRLNLNIGDAAQIEQLIRAYLPDDEVPIVQGNGDLMIRCPFHSDNNPSCSVSPSKHGCFHCFGCEKNGTLSGLIMRLKSFSSAETIQHLSATLGVQSEFQQPDKNAVSIYSYLDEKGKLLKQVLRFPDENGQKVFRQRRPGKGGWTWKLSGLPPMLYHMERLQYADTVCIPEGEKDAETVTNLCLKGQYGEVIGTTSGGAESWNSRLAEHLRGKRVVLLPDADAAGARFAEAVKKSLEAEGIEYREVSFADVGAKDVTDFMETHTAEDLVRRIGTDWVRMPNGQRLEDDILCVDVIPSTETELQDITI